MHKSETVLNSDIYKIMTVMEAVPSSSLPMQLAEIPKFGERRRAASDPVDTPAKRRCGA
jgi:hypothetical protein